MRYIFIDYFVVVLSHTITFGTKGERSAEAYFGTIVSCAAPLSMSLIAVLLGAGFNLPAPIVVAIVVAACALIWVGSEFWIGRAVLFAVLDHPGHMARARSRVFRLFVDALGVLFLYILVQAARLYFML